MGEAEGLLLVAHGSARYPEVGRIAAAHVARIAAADPSRPVALGLLNGAPSVAEAVAALAVPLIRVVPFFMEDGYFVRVAVPKALGRTEGIRLCPPVGVHDGMAGLIRESVRAGCAAAGLSPETVAVLVVGHGSARAPGRALALHRHTESVATGGGFALVRSACLEEAPFLGDALAALCGHPVAVVGFFAGEGGHVRDDVPEAIAREVVARGPGGLPVLNCGSVMDHPGVAGIILAQAAVG